MKKAHSMVEEARVEKETIIDIKCDTGYDIMKE